MSSPNIWDDSLSPSPMLLTPALAQNLLKEKQQAQNGILMLGPTSPIQELIGIGSSGNGFLNSQSGIA